MMVSVTSRLATCSGRERKSSEDVAVLPGRTKQEQVILSLKLVSILP